MSDEEERRKIKPFLLPTKLTTDAEKSTGTRPTSDRSRRIRRKVHAPGPGVGAESRQMMP